MESSVAPMETTSFLFILELFNSSLTDNQFITFAKTAPTPKPLPQKVVHIKTTINQTCPGICSDRVSETEWAWVSCSVTGVWEGWYPMFREHAVNDVLPRLKWASIAGMFLISQSNTFTGFGLHFLFISKLACALCFSPFFTAA